MGIGVALFLIAVGAILKFAVADNISGIDLSAIGVILLIVGILGLILTLLFWSPWSPSRRRTRIVERDVPGERRIERDDLM
jgi:hypothetical protein